MTSLLPAGATALKIGIAGALAAISAATAIVTRERDRRRARAARQDYRGRHRR